ncbi:MAG: molybdopterin molybdotransferase MoeA [Candidatus Omnitrophica bacterium]|nr:molybdopterin molybdotransferase MoeA [Candidatus Omnitrophota bacterium]
MISVEEAWRRIEERIEPLAAEPLPLEAAEGFVLAKPITAPIDLPPFDNSAMDGYALRAGETQTARAERPVKLPVAGEVAAGGWQDKPVAPGTAVKIMTGAPLPPGADSVLMLEDGRLRDGAVEIRGPVDPGRHVRRQGEDVRRGQVLLEPGLRLNPQRLALLASAGIREVPVHRRARVSLLATGSELAAPGAPLRPGQIYDSNRITLKSLLRAGGSTCDDLGVVPDDPAAITKQIRTGLGRDLLLVSGGVSVGSHDHVKQVLRELGMETLFWQVAMKPGKPLLCGRLGPTWIFGLPGNPISCVVGFLIFIEPLIRRLEGKPRAKPRYAKARLTQDLHKKDDRRHFLTARVSAGSDGFLEAAPTEKQGSAMMQALAQANAFVVAPEDCPFIPAGKTVEVLLFNG